MERSNMALVKETLLEELSDKVKAATELKKQLDASKTKHKRQYYQKKLKKNNEDVAYILMALDKLSKKDERDVSETQPTEPETKIITTKPNP